MGWLVGADKEKKESELRSEKVRNIVGKIPPLLLRIGITIISVIIIAVLIVAYYFPYKEYKAVEVELFCRPAFQRVAMPEDGNVFIMISSMKVKKDQLICYIQTGTDSIIKLYTHSDGKIIFDCIQGDFLKKEKEIYTIIPDSIKSVYGIAYIPEEDISRIHVGQQVNFIPTTTTIYVDQMEGHVSRIYPVLSTYRNIQNKAVYKVEISFPEYKPLVRDLAPSFYPDIKGNGQILISDKAFLKRILRAN